MPHKPRPMFRFTIRDVLWLMVVAALGVGWGLEHWLFCDRMRIVRRYNPMLYETLTGQEVDTNNLNPDGTIKD
jgi:hypothetical protein